MPPLDGLRGLAILMVMLFHYATGLTSQSTGQRMVRAVAAFGWTGVDLFFVLSGFLITGILLDTREDDGYFSSFYVRRVLRIFPVYYLSLLVCFFVAPILLPGIAGSLPLPSQRIWFVLYLQNWMGILVDGGRQMLMGHFWSLAIEEQFYLVWPWIVYRSSTKRILQIAVGGSVASVLIRLALVAFHVTPEIIYRNTFTRMDALLIGAACTCLLRDPVWVARFRRYAAWMWLAPLAGLSVLRLTTHSFNTHDPGVQGLGFSVIALGYGALLVGVVLTMGERSLVQSFFCSGMMRTVGKYSYAAYIWHQLVRALVMKAEVSTLHGLPPGPINIVLMTAATLAVCVLSYVTVERPFLALKDRFTPRLADRRPLTGRPATAG
jgi:peptidoglycan/LPS O-acetylase OafA/YrhL